MMISSFFKKNFKLKLRYSNIWTDLNFNKVNMALHIVSQIYVAVPTTSE